MGAGGEEESFVQARQVLGYELPEYEYVTPPELRSGEPRRHAVIVVGGGLAGLTATLDLVTRGIPAVLVDEDNTVGARGLSSRGVNYARRTMEVFERLGVDVRTMLAKGMVWKVHRTYYGVDTAYAYEMNPEAGHKHPAMLALQQFYVEMLLVERLRAVGAELRWKNRVTAVTRHADHVELEIDTPEGVYRTTTDWLLACDGAHSSVRRSIGVETTGERVGRWFIADVLMQADYPRERHLWINPPFNPGQSALLIEMAGGAWRTDMQLSDDADPRVEVAPERIRSRLDRMLGTDKNYRIVWAGAYAFKFRCMESFRHGRVIFLGDAAHENPPFGGRGGNSGVQDADNLGWKLELVLRGAAPERLLDTYDAERRPAALENIAQSSRSAAFLSPRTPGRRVFRDAVLALAKHCEFAQKLVNSGRMSVPFDYSGSPLAAEDESPWSGGPRPGSAAPNAQVCRGGVEGFLLDAFRGRFTLLGFLDSPEALGEAQAGWLKDLRDGEPRVESMLVARRDGASELEHCVDAAGDCFARYAARPGDWYLLRPDQHVAARWSQAPLGLLKEKVRRALGRATAAEAPALRPFENALPEPKRLDERIFERLVSAYDDLDQDRRERFLANLAILLLANSAQAEGALGQIETAAERARNWS